jgi:rhodanese-related sulfurtransferase
VQSKLPNKSEPLLFGCKAGGRSAKAIGMLSDYTDTTNVTGGFGAWLAQGLPTEK